MGQTGRRGGKRLGVQNQDDGGKNVINQQDGGQGNEERLRIYS